MGISEALPAQDREKLRRSLAFARAMIEELSVLNIPYRIERVEADGQRITLMYGPGDIEEDVEGKR